MRSHTHALTHTHRALLTTDPRTHVQQLGQQHAGLRGLTPTRPHRGAPTGGPAPLNGAPSASWGEPPQPPTDFAGLRVGLKARCAALMQMQEEAKTQ